MPKPKVVTIADREASLGALSKKYPDLYTAPVIEPVPQSDILSFPGLSLNILCGADRGIRKGSIVHWYGPRGSLKTWIALEMAREAQRKWPDKIVGVIDTERRIDLYQASTLIHLETKVYDTGVPRLIYRRPETAEQAWEQIGDFAASGHFSLIILDSGTTMRSQSVVDNPEFSLGQVGNAARINSAALQKYSPLFEQTGTILWGINQERITSIQPVVTKGPTGGAAWGYYCTHEFKVARSTRERETETQALTIRSEKMKWALGFREIEVPIILGHGINAEGDILTAGLEAGIVNKNGSWWSYNGENIGQGIGGASEVLRQKPELTEEIASHVNELALT